MSRYGNLPIIVGLEDGKTGLKSKLASKTSLVGELWVLLRDSTSRNKVGAFSRITGSPHEHIHMCPYHSTQEPTQAKTWTHVYNTHMKMERKKKRINY